MPYYSAMAKRPRGRPSLYDKPLVMLGAGVPRDLRSRVAAAARARAISEAALIREALVEFLDSGGLSPAGLVD